MENKVTLYTVNTYTNHKDVMMTKGYLDAYACLYGDKTVPVTIKKKRRTDIASEEQEQTRLAAWLDKKGVVFYHIPNGMRSNAHQGAKFKRMGMKAGVPDICIPIARSPHHGLYIELKRVDGGIISGVQQYWLEVLQKEGYCAVVCKGADEAIKCVQSYLEGGMVSKVR